ncbi:hypothetical protein DFJ74DRAFT_464401 [Hyaloraphidium curvatum]|nr:hypothetical protein DFJ74DRAFT_464401 [Hyaloraphidium curvatum]
MTPPPSDPLPAAAPEDDEASVGGSSTDRRSSVAGSASSAPDPADAAPPLPAFDDDARFRPLPRSPPPARPLLPIAVAALPAPSLRAPSLLDAASVSASVSTRLEGDIEVDLDAPTELLSLHRTESDARTLASRRHGYSSGSSDEEEGKGDAGKRKVTRKGVLHWVQATDTLVGLSLKYGVSVESIRLTNKLYGSSIFERGYLLVPVTNWTGPTHSVRSEEDERKALVKRFQLLAKCVHPEEALSYMLRFDYDLDAALEAYWADARWERENPFSGTRRRCLGSPSRRSSARRGRGGRCGARCRFRRRRDVAGGQTSERADGRIGGDGGRGCGHLVILFLCEVRRG